jgi:hypothetical protein
MLNDLMKMALIGLALTACSGDKSATTDSGADTDTDTTDTDTTPACDLSCTDYCTTFLANCETDAANTYADETDCETQCAAFDCGTSDDTSGDTLGCRIYHANAAATDPATHCIHASAAGTGGCE